MAYWDYAGKSGLQGAESTLLDGDDYPRIEDGTKFEVKDEDNPAVLDDATIAYALRTSRAARAELEATFDDLDTESQTRLTNLVRSNPRMTSLQKDPQQQADDVQSAWNKGIKIRTVGPRGGKGW